jgi:hypothetical protein
MMPTRCPTGSLGPSLMALRFTTTMVAQHILEITLVENFVMRSGITGNIK